MRLRLLSALVLTAGPLAAQVTSDVPAVRPAAVVDLRTREGTGLVGATWRYTDVRIVPVAHHAVGADLKPSGPPNMTNDIEPRLDSLDYDDRRLQVLDPTSLEQRRGNGRLSFAWYLLSVTIPARVGALDPTGMTVVFEITVDDYAEVWVNGELNPVLGQAGGQLVKGWNSPNRVVLTRAARPGDTYQIAVFGINAPISSPPGNYIWIREATLDFYPAGVVGGGTPVETRITRLDPALDGIVPPDAKIERLATGFLFTEGPVWVREGGYLLFSDPNANTIYRWTPDGAVSVWRAKSGYAGLDIGEYGQPGSNGITVDPQGRITVDQHGNRRVIRIERNGLVTPLAERYQGKRLNSPNDLVYRSDGTLYFTDPPFGLPRVYDDPRKELPWSGVFMVKDGELRLLTSDLAGPNGIALSPDEKYLYVGNWDEQHKIVMRYEVQPDGSVRNGRVFADLTPIPGEDAIDGVKVDRNGNVYISGPGGLWIYSADGRRLGAINGPEHPHNFAWGDEDGRTLYLTARTGLYRIRLNVEGVRP